MRYARRICEVLFMFKKKWKREASDFFFAFVSRPIPFTYIPSTGNECGRKPIAMYVISGHSWRRMNAHNGDNYITLVVCDILDCNCMSLIKVDDQLKPKLIFLTCMHTEVFSLRWGFFEDSSRGTHNKSGTTAVKRVCISGKLTTMVILCTVKLGYYVPSREMKKGTF